MHLPNTLTNFVEANFEDEFGTLADFMKANMHKKAPDLFRRLRFEDDDNFVEPLFILKNGYNPAPDFSFEQILFGYMEEDKRPAHFKVLSNKKGVVYMPRLGYLKTGAPNALIDFFHDDATREIRLELDGSPLPYTLIPPKMLLDSRIELVRDNNPLNDDNYGSREDPKEVDIESAFNDHAGHVEKAMEIIRSEYPWYYGFIEKSVKKIVIFYNDQVRSFASQTTTGISYLSARKTYNEVFFLEDIVHQCSHNILYILTIRINDYFAVDAKNGRINQYNGNENDQRVIYSAFHGVFSLVNICTAMALIMQKNLFEGDKKYELTGRFSDNLKRLGHGLKAIKYREIYTEKGWSLLEAIEERYLALWADYGALADQYNTVNQPYVFDYELFLRENPL